MQNHLRHLPLPRIAHCSTLIPVPRPVTSLSLPFLLQPPSLASMNLFPSLLASSISLKSTPPLTTSSPTNTPPRLPLPPGDACFMVRMSSSSNASFSLKSASNNSETASTRMQVATDLAHGLDYIHNKSGINISLTHNHIKSSSIIVTEPSFNARICHFGAAQLCNEDDWNKIIEKPSSSRCNNGHIAEDSKKKSHLKDKQQLLKSKKVQIKGVRGYMAPEYKSSGVATPMTDVYAFGVVILELLSGEEPLKFEFDRRKGSFVKVSLIENAMAVMEEGGDDVGGRLRKWMDRRLKDSFPIHVAEKITRLAIQCVDVDPAKRPNMANVATKISKLYLESRIWSDNMAVPANFSISLSPR